MSDVATLLTAIGGLLGAIFAGLTSILALRIGSPRERKDAAAKALERVLDTDDEDATPDRRKAIKELQRELQRQQLLRELEDLGDGS